VVHRQ
jgi:hypothetical protein